MPWVKPAPCLRGEESADKPGTAVVLTPLCVIVQLLLLPEHHQYHLLLRSYRSLAFQLVQVISD